MIGKYLNDFPAPDGSDPLTVIPPGWDEWYANLGPVGTLRSGVAYYNYIENRNGQLRLYVDSAGHYSTDVMARTAGDFVCRASSDTRPFLLYVAPHAPHPPATPAPRHSGRYASTIAPRAPSFNEEDVSDKIGYLRDLPRLTDAQVAELDALYGRMLEAQLAVDELLGVVIEALESTRLLSRTFIIYTADNGLHFGEHRLNAVKGTHFEEASLVPLLIRGPGVRPGVVRSEFILNSDLAPTLVELAGIVAPQYVDGRSLVPLLTGGDPPWRRAILLETYAVGAAQSAIRTKDYFYREGEFYDMRADPYQLRNLAGSMEQALRVELMSWLTQLRGCAGAACRSAEDSAFVGAAGDAWAGQSGARSGTRHVRRGAR
jgi:arylsulfatase A-like enzyme